MRVFAFQIAAGRALLGWSPKDLAHEAGLSLYQVQKIEGTPGDLEPSKQLVAIASTLIAKGVIFTRDLSRIGVALDLRKR